MPKFDTIALRSCWSLSPPLVFLPLPQLPIDDRLLRKKVLQASPENVLTPAWGQEVTLKMQGVLEDRTVVEKDCKLVFIIGEGDVNQVRHIDRQRRGSRTHTHTSLGTPACILPITSHLLPAEFSIGIKPVLSHVEFCMCLPKAGKKSPPYWFTFRWKVSKVNLVCQLV